MVTTLDDIGWILNLRGSDVDCNPVFIGYLVIGLEKTWLFINPTQMNDVLKNRLNHDNIFIKNYTTLLDFLQTISPKETLLIDAANANFSVFYALKNVKIEEETTFSSLMKAIKDETEQHFIREVMVKDGVALVKAFRWLEKNLRERPVSEYEFASMIAQYRSDQPHYYGESFPAIVGYNANGAIIHYQPTFEDSALIHTEGVLLVDSGGQYADGTTDITRTIALSEPSAEVKKHYTLVLKGHIALARAQFPKGTRGIQLDTLARQFLWQEGLNYGHGTGHGVGYFMNVHEPPQGFTAGLNARGKTEQEIGMLSSNEPGFYMEGAYGIRIENLILTIEAPNLTQKGANTEGGHFLAFETVSLFPIDTQLIDKQLLTPAETDWFNRYHDCVFDKLSPQLDAAEKEWLKEKCTSI
ncbi:MAG: aminopeptidase P family protein [Saprospiraceae bacterium]|nr:aminopeptidase P family protein [Saprospiraceae bacterium]